MALGDLTTIANAKAWLKVTTTNDDVVLQRLVSQGSTAIMNWLQRSSCLSRSFTDTKDGSDQPLIFLDNWPVTAVSQVAIDGRVIAASPMVIGSQGVQTPGWRLQPWDGFLPGGDQAVELIGYRFARGRQNVQINYTAGYLVANEAQTVPASPGPYTATVNQLQGPWAQDAGVTYANGTALTPVSGTPSAGQYSAPTTTPGQYTFAAADQGAGVLISYSFVPGPLEDACIDWVSERYRYRDRIGEKSRSVGGQQTAAYDTSDLPGYLKLQLQQYRRVLPVA